RAVRNGAGGAALVGRRIWPLILPRRAVRLGLVESWPRECRRLSGAVTSELGRCRAVAAPTSWPAAPYRSAQVPSTVAGLPHGPQTVAAPPRSSGPCHVGLSTIVFG